MPSVKECLNVHIGQAGVQTGRCAWELFTHEHGILPDGTKDGDCGAPAFEDDSYVSFFHETPSGQHVPRAVFVDTEPTVINDIKVSRMRNLFHPDTLVAFKQDCKNNFFEGRTMASAFKIQDVVIDRIRLEVDKCDCPQGFFVTHSVGGGTGSGVTVEVLHDLRDQFGKMTIIEPVIYPSTHFSSCIVEPYNCLLATHFTSGAHNCVDLSLMLDNEAAYKICDQQLQIKTPDFSHVNRLIAQCLSGATAPLRYETELNATLYEIHTNLVSFNPTVVRFPLMSLAPIRHSQRGAHEKFQTSEIIKELFDEKNCLCDCKRLSANRYLSAVLIMRGEGSQDDGDLASSSQGTTNRKSEQFKPISTSAVMKALGAIRNPPASKSHVRRVKFVPWMEGSGIKLGIVKALPSVPPSFKMAQTNRQGVLIGNTTAVRQLFVRQYLRFLKLYYHKAYIWQYIGANGDEDTFTEAKETMRSIIDEYELLMRDSKGEEDSVLDGATMRLHGATDRGAQLHETTGGPVSQGASTMSSIQSSMQDTQNSMQDTRMRSIPEGR